MEGGGVLLVKVQLQRSPMLICAFVGKWENQNGIGETCHILVETCVDGDVRLNGAHTSVPSCVIQAHVHLVQLLLEGKYFHIYSVLVFNLMTGSAKMFEYGLQVFKMPLFRYCSVFLILLYSSFFYV